jgi:mediator of RNA polymerase II transcription subunit 21
MLTLAPVEPLEPEQFQAGLLELSRDLILKEQQIEVLISTLPGLDTSEADQEKNVRELEEELKVAEAQRQDAIREKDQILAKLDQVIRNVKRP